MSEIQNLLETFNFLEVIHFLEFIYISEPIKARSFFGCIMIAGLFFRKSLEFHIAQVCIKTTKQIRKYILNANQCFPLTRCAWSDLIQCLDDQAKHCGAEGPPQFRIIGSPGQPPTSLPTLQPTTHPSTHPPPYPHPPPYHPPPYRPLGLYFPPPTE